MNKYLRLLAFLFISGISLCQAQSRVFKTVGAEMSYTVKAIMQDEVLMGYVIFSKLEKVNNDSFSYKLTIMDENLNDIGTYSFKDGDVQLQQVAFEQDVLCLAYLKNIYKKPAKDVKRRKVMGANRNVVFYNESQADREDYYKFVPENIKSFVYTQFLSLEGKLIASANEPVKLIYNQYAAHFANSFNGYLKNALQLSSVAGKGFALVFGDGDKESVGQKKGSDENLLVYDLQGNERLKKRLSPAISEGLELVSSGPYIHVLRRTAIEAGIRFELLSYNLEDSSFYQLHKVGNKESYQYKVMAFRKRAGSSIPYLSGMIINEGRPMGVAQNRSIKQGFYAGVFNIDLNGADYKEHFTYWSGNKKKDAISSKGYIRKASAYSDVDYTYDDYNGNTYFSGSGIKTSTRWGTIVASVLTIPTVVTPPFILFLCGTTKFNHNHLVTLQQDSSGKLSCPSIHKTKNGSYVMGSKLGRAYPNTKSLFAVHNDDKRATYLVFSDADRIAIYDVQTQKEIRSIPTEKRTVNVYPAKAGHILLSEYSSGDGSTKLSIESL
jgi:hypothetical protein